VSLNERGSERRKSEHRRVRTSKVFLGWSERRKSKKITTSKVWSERRKWPIYSVWPYSYSLTSKTKFPFSIKRFIN
jgi:hypothetical protein